MHEKRAADWLIHDLEKQSAEHEAIHEDELFEDPYGVKSLIYQTEHEQYDQAVYLFDTAAQFVDQHFKSNGTPARRYRVQEHSPVEVGFTIEYGGDLGVCLEFPQDMAARSQETIDPRTGLTSIVTTGFVTRLHVNGGSSRYHARPRRYNIQLGSYVKPHQFSRYPKAKNLYRNTNSRVVIEDVERATIVGEEATQEVKNTQVNRDIGHEEIAFALLIVLHPRRLDFCLPPHFRICIRALAAVENTSLMTQSKIHPMHMTACIGLG